MRELGRQILTKSFVLAGLLALATPAQAMTFQLGVEVTSAPGGNALGAVVGTTANAGTGDIGSQTVDGLPFESKSTNPSFDAGASLALTIGNVLFGEEDDIEAGVASDIPALLFTNGAFVGLDFVSLFTISGNSAIGVAFDPFALAQDTSPFEDGNHYWADFFDDGSFQIGLVTGFVVVTDPQEGDELSPVFGTPPIAGNVFVPEPSLAILTVAAMLGVAALRRR